MGFWKELGKWGAAAATGGASLLVDGTAKELWNDFTGKTAVQEANKANAAEAEKNRNWQEYMSNTAMTRQMQDLANAGLNPNAATALGGASTPGGAQATMQAEPSDVQSALGLAQTVASVAGGMSDIATATKTMTENKYLPESTKAQISNVNASTAMTSAQTNKINAETQQIEAQTQIVNKQYQILSEEDKIRVATLYNRYASAIKNSANERIVNSIVGEFLDTEFGRDMKKLGLSLGEIGQILQPAVNAYGIYQNGRNTFQRGFAAGYSSN